MPMQLADPNWSFITFSGSFRETVTFLLLEQQILDNHAAASNIKMYLDL